MHSDRVKLPTKSMFSSKHTFKSVNGDLEFYHKNDENTVNNETTECESIHLMKTKTYG